MITAFPKKIVLGITGGIAAYKAALLTRQLKELDIDVRVVMTRGAESFISSLTLQALSHNPVHNDTFNETSEAAMGHIELAKWADMILVAPATANFIAKISHGICDDLLSTLCLATKAPIYIAPAMNQAMWSNPITAQNITQLKQYHFNILGPNIGIQACGDHGFGRMLEPEDIINHIIKPSDSRPTPLLNQHVLITAGPTREHIDPVRFLSNPSSGKMGFSLAAAAVNLGAKVTVIAGPVDLETPPGVTRINIESALEMHKKALEIHCDIFIGCAAVADYRCEQPSTQKIKKQHKTSLHLNLIPNPDIISSITQQGSPPFTVGFAAETDHLENYAIDKMKKKSLNMIFANNVSSRDIGFGSNMNQITAFINHQADMSPIQFPAMEKSLLATELMMLIAKHYPTKGSIKS
jgi:phosphopantothenoylcysteine decarboxylase / phosphopantothenate---cysteine ligase